MEQPGDYISSVAWIKEDNYLAVGTSNAEMQLWNVQQAAHSARVSSLSWNSYILSRSVFFPVYSRTFPVSAIRN